jgi:predicted CXXCH cytochrome family protein
MGTLILLIALAGPAFLFDVLSAKVTGPCANCHTMHNSQDDSSLLPSPQGKLLTSDCVGCHSSSGPETVVSLSGTVIPIVRNIVLPTSPLAGGNFYWVENTGDTCGHNVIEPDAILDHAPGSPSCGFEGCHVSLASIRYGTGPGPLFNPIRGNGCIGCHDTRQAHHKGGGQEFGNGYRLVGVPGDGSAGFRFIGRAGQVYWDIPPHTPPNVAGVEAPWNILQNQSASSHNEYQDYSKPGAYLAYMGNPQGISDFCAGCHQQFHSWGANGEPNGGYGNSWLRHPVAYALPDSGEYANYTVYDPVVPVARTVDALLAMTSPSSVVTPGEDRVMCLSCHYAHGGPYPDALRWDYTEMEVGSGNTNGCFVCHSMKN